jgi:hypothetical protein
MVQVNSYAHIEDVLHLFEKHSITSWGTKLLLQAAFERCYAMA